MTRKNWQSPSWFDWLPARQQIDPVDGSNCFSLKHNAPHLEVRHTEISLQESSVSNSIARFMLSAAQLASGISIGRGVERETPVEHFKQGCRHGDRSSYQHIPACHHDSACRPHSSQQMAREKASSSDLSRGVMDHPLLSSRLPPNALSTPPFTMLAGMGS